MTNFFDLLEYFYEKFKKQLVVVNPKQWRLFLNFFKKKSFRKPPMGRFFCSLRRARNFPRQRRKK
ncbi:MAG: hypothetical protein COZ85_03535 [Candidatus Moranbacteria bacterium CG_4_8_14_3_um_filter_34_16]|nr:MAG: hypothetical protein COZ85_03535 [Candidatus Moranbacteria bacterium CG_4_8_14_3_um_filter_34_16]